MQRNQRSVLAARVAALRALLGPSQAEQSQAITLVAARENSTPEFRPRLPLEFLAPTCGGVTNYCVAVANAIVDGATLAASGSKRFAANSLSLQVVSLSAGVTHVLLIGSNADALVNGSRALDFNAAPLAGTVAAGDVRNFQCWFRDPTAGGTGSQLSGAISASFCP